MLDSARAHARGVRCSQGTGGLSSLPLGATQQNKEKKNKLDKSKIRQPQSHPFHRAQHADPAAASAQSANEGIDWHHARHVYNPELATQPAPSAPQQKSLHVSSIASFHASIVHTTKEHRPGRFAQHVHQDFSSVGLGWGRKTPSQLLWTE